MDNSLFIKNILILIFCVIIIHIFLNDFLDNKTCNSKDSINSKERFNNTLVNDDNKTLVYLFYADWCGHCKHYKPIFNNFKDKIGNANNIDIIEINADSDIPEKQELYTKYNIDGFPTTIIQKNNNFKKLVGQQTLETLMNIVHNTEYFGNVEFNTDSPDIFNKNNTDIFNKNNTSVFNKDNNIIVYNFNTTWCTHSKQFQPIWKNFSDIVNSYENIKTVDVKCDLDDNINFCNKFNVKSVPSIIIVRNNELIPYEGSRTVEGLLNILQLNINNNDKKELVNNDEFMILNNNEIKADLENIKISIYNFNTSWCKYSRDFEPEWNIFVNSIKNSDGIRAIDVKCDNDQNKDLCKKYDIPGYPSIVIETENRIEIYNGPRDALSLRKYLKL
jgi:thiol-disulfide isomerase/thioredoxin